MSNATLTAGPCRPVEPTRPGHPPRGWLRAARTTFALGLVGLGAAYAGVPNPALRGEEAV